MAEGQGSYKVGFKKIIRWSFFNPEATKSS